MSNQLVNRSPDLKRLRDEGHEIEVRNDGYLCVHHIPYLDKDTNIQFGTLVSSLVLSGDKTVTPDTHVIYFIGQHPCESDGVEISSIKNDNTTRYLTDTLYINCTFSNKPPNGYPNYYEKVRKYIDIISAPAKAKDNSVTELTFKVVVDTSPESVFEYIDTNTSRANIGNINSKFDNQIIAIIGLGGTGSYILDLVAKTSVKEIHIYDNDWFDQHNSFRTPGAASIDDLSNRSKKIDYLKRQYSKMRKNIFTHSEYITALNVHELSKMSFVFISVDKNEARYNIANYLVKLGVPFVDVGMGVKIKSDQLYASLRVTAATKDKNDHLDNRICNVNVEEGIYSTNIQIAELNALNACLAVIMWKKKIGVYYDDVGEHNIIFSTLLAEMINEDFKA